MYAPVVVRVDRLLDDAVVPGVVGVLEMRGRRAAGQRIVDGFRCAVPSPRFDEPADFVPVVGEELGAVAEDARAVAGDLEAGHVAGVVVAGLEVAASRAGRDPGALQLVRLVAGGVVLDAAEAAIVEAAGIVARLGGVAEPVVLVRLVEDALVESDVGARRGSSRVVCAGRILLVERVLPGVVAGGVLVVDPRRSIEVVVLDFLA